MTPQAIIIRELCTRLHRDHGYAFGDIPDARKMSRAVAIHQLQGLESATADTEFMTFVKRQTDMGRYLENADRHAAAIRDLEQLTKAGILPQITPRKDGVLASIVGALSWGNMSTEESRLLSELRTQGVIALRNVAAPDTAPAPEQLISQINDEMSRWAKERDLLITRLATDNGASRTSVKDLLDLLLVSDPHDGLSNTQEFLVKRQKIGLQGIVKDGYENGNRRTDYDALVALGVLPKIERPAPTGSFISRMIGHVGNAMSSVPSNEDLPALTEMGRDVLRAALDERVIGSELDPRARAEMRV